MTEKEILKRIYPSVVTYIGDWQKMLVEANNLRLKEISLFLTCASLKEREKIYQSLEKTSIKAIPHVHYRHDMKESEIEYLIKKYKTKVFTAHYKHYLKFLRKSKYRKKFFVETNLKANLITNYLLLKDAGGVCVDLSHFEEFRWHYPKQYEISKKAVDNCLVGCNHVSAVLPDGKSWHRVSRNSELDYLKNISQKYFSKYLCLELANPIKEQLELKKYIAKILAKSWKD